MQAQGMSATAQPPCGCRFCHWAARRPTATRHVGEAPRVSAEAPTVGEALRGSVRAPQGLTKRRG